MMDAQVRLKLTLGDMLVQIAMLSARVEELEAELEKKKANGGLEQQNRTADNERPAL